MKNIEFSEYSIDHFIDEIWSTHGLSENTLNSYRSDIKNFLLFLARNKIKISSVSKEDINQYISKRFAQGISSKSNMRLISALKKFFLFMKNNNHIQHNPTDKLIIPKKMICKLSEAQTYDKDLLGHLLLVAAEVAKKMNTQEAFNIVINNGEGAGQTVFHLHIHLLAGRNFSDFLPG